MPQPAHPCAAQPRSATLLRDPAALPRYAAGPPHLPCCAVLPPIGHASRPAPTARPAEFAGAASYTWTLIRKHAHTHARRQAQTHLKALAAASRPPADADRRQQHASRTGRYSKCGRHWAGPARGGAGYALQRIVTSVSASSVSYHHPSIAQLLLGDAAKASARAQQEQGALARAHAHGAARGLTRQGPVRRRQVLGASPDPQDLRASTPDAILA